MVKSLEQVKEFHEVFGHPILDKPQIPGENRSSLRVKLLQEELDELKEAIENKDLIEIADALADLQYVLNGAVLEFGLKDKFEALNDEVHRSNMSKAYDSKEEAEKEAEYLTVLKDTNIYAVETNPGIYITLRHDGKLIKNPKYSPADLKSILETEKDS